MRIESKYYHLTGKTKAENVRFRKLVMELAADNPGYREELWIMCKRDPLF